jgi:hypothetical protein
MRRRPWPQQRLFAAISVVLPLKDPFPKPTIDAGVWRDPVFE